MNKVVKVGAILILIGAVAAAGYFFWKYKKASANLTTVEISELTKKIGKIILLPAGETPTLATVTDKTRLEGQKFFKNSQNGDKVLIYAMASKAILYRPTNNQIIEVASITTNDQNQMALPTQAIKANLKIAIYNGTQMNGLATKWQKNVAQVLTNSEVVSKSSAKESYQATIVIDLKGNLSSEAKELAAGIGAKISSLPTGEEKPDADLLVIIGGDKE
jgi:hypothetical protein